MCVATVESGCARPKDAVKLLESNGVGTGAADVFDKQVIINPTGSRLCDEYGRVFIEEQLGLEGVLELSETVDIRIWRVRSD